MTFHQEFHGRRFDLIDKHLVTGIPWTPGQRDVTFSYHFPMEETKATLEWSVDAPCALCASRSGG